MQEDVKGRGVCPQRYQLVIAVERYVPHFWKCQRSAVQTLDFLKPSLRYRI